MRLRTTLTAISVLAVFASGINVNAQVIRAVSDIDSTPVVSQASVRIATKTHFCDSDESNAKRPRDWCGTACDGADCDSATIKSLRQSLCCNPAKWTMSADALFLNRRDPSSTVLAVNTAKPNQNLNANDFNFGVQTGYDLSLMRRIGCDSGIEVRYFGVDHWRAPFSATTTPGDLLRLDAAIPVFTIAGTGADANYASALHNTEINGRRYLNQQLCLLAGFRYAELNETLASNLVGSAVPFSYNNSTHNRLYGFQLGGQTWLYTHKAFSLDVVGKAGIYGNSAAQDSTINTGLVTLAASGIGSRAAFIGEIGATGAFKVTEHFRIHGGYRLLWLDGVAVASKQLAVSNFANGTGFNGASGVFYNGAFAGLEYVY